MCEPARQLATALVCVAVAAATPAQAQPNPPEPAAAAVADDGDDSAAPETSPVPEPTTAADVERAPEPEQASGIAVPESRAGHAWRWVPRVALFIPRWTLWIAILPVRGGLWAFERYQIADRAKSIFFNDEETLGAYPLAFFETGLGLNVGGRIIYRDLFGTEGKARLRASYGGRFRQLYSAQVTTGHLLGDRAELELEGQFEIYPRSRFFGLGNSDLIDGTSIMSPVDPRARDTAVKTRYRHDDLGVELVAAIDLGHDLSVRLSGGFLSRDFTGDADVPADEYDIAEIYQTDRLAGFGDDMANVGGEVELVYDSRRPTVFWAFEPNPNTGAKLATFAGIRRGIGDDPSNYLRYGLDLQRVFDIYDGSRMLYLRGYLEGVTGGTADVPFTDLPALGGPLFLRGYARGRFRDRVAALASAEYRYTVNKFLAAYLFVDGGRVYQRLSDLSTDGLRVGYGAGIQAHSRTTFRGRFDVSTSVDGGLFFNLSFDPVYDTSSREVSQ